MDRKPTDDLIRLLDPKGKDFIAVLSTFKTNDRLLLQQGVFLAATDITKPFQKVLESMDGHNNKVRQIQIVDGADEILTRLYRAGVNRALLFPGLQGFSESLRSKILTYLETDKIRLPGVNWDVSA